ncbi:hypothetical protein ABFS82_11G129300 [Erythranthe guttata]|uniref:uncharacterized protein LOC105960998 n=1 Tax=Erythranthe guttata TaxID=4155 RepID=UPI00064DC37D|nr:PREDICTED: uncharacterized protein LOC105960998 [Erythranthe guttata]|eukprot:XP_012840682.1 PREDICTED: uncharacterized protein LOC105960998 [Erythranthe guttata]
MLSEFFHSAECCARNLFFRTQFSRPILILSFEFLGDCAFRGLFEDRLREDLALNAAVVSNLLHCCSISRWKLLICNRSSFPVAGGVYSANIIMNTGLASL